jgi:hypothetical protein
MIHADIIHMFREMLSELREAETLITSAGAIDHLNNIRRMIYTRAEELRIDLEEIVETK